MDTKQALTPEQFLELLPKPIRLIAIHPERSAPVGKSFDEVEAALVWAKDQNGKRNIYYHLNPLWREPEHAKSRKEDVGALAGLHVDKDPTGKTCAEWDAERESLLETFADAVPEPTVVIDSGRGVQGLWLLETPVNLQVNGKDQPPAAETFAVHEAYNRALEERFGGDAVSNLDRVLRLPGFVNHKTGRVAEVIHFSGKRYNLRDLPHSVPNTGTGLAPSGLKPAVVIPTDSVEGLLVDNATKGIILHGKDLADPDRHPSRSEWVHAVCCAMVRAGEADATIAAILLANPDLLKIAAYVRVTSDGRKRTARQVERIVEREIRNARKAVNIEGQEFVTDKHGKPYGSQENVRLAIAKLNLQLSFDEFAQRELINGEFLGDSRAAQLYLEIESRFGFRVAKDYFQTVLTVVTRENSFHPVRDYLDELTWDGTERLDTWLSTYLGAQDSEYTRAVGTITLTAAVRRIRHPGCKFDEMLILEDPRQGSAKSSTLATLAVRPDWFSDDLPLGADTKRSIEALAGRWIVEAAELKGMRKGDVDHLKSFLSRTIDRARMAYGRRAEEHSRQCVIIGTTNSERYLKDATGNRRFWPVRTGVIDLAALRRDRDQLWAEAVAREGLNASIRLDPKLWDAAQVAQEARRSLNPMREALEDALGDLNGILASEDAWRIVGKALPAGRTQQDCELLNEALRDLGFERTRRRRNGRLVYCYSRGDGSLGWCAMSLDSESGRWQAKGEYAVQRSDEGENKLSF